jgi:hypothetical protein
MGMLADAPFAATVAAPGHVALEASHAIELQSPQPGSKTDAASAIQPLHATIRNVTIANSHSFSRRGVVLKGLFGLIVMIAFPSSEHVTQRRMSRAARADPASSTKVVLERMSINASPGPAASLEAESVIERWFILPQPPGAIAAQSTTSPIGLLRVFPRQ